LQAPSREDELGTAESRQGVSHRARRERGPLDELAVGEGPGRQEKMEALR